jgi:CD109 antigen
MWNIGRVGRLAAVLAGLAAAAGAQEGVSLVALAPENLFAGGTGSITVTSLDSADRTPVDVAVTVWMETTDGSATYPLAGGHTGPQGRFFQNFPTPDVAPGSYRLKVQGPAGSAVLQSPVTVRSLPVLFVETDKPIYRPGQAIQGRVLLLNNQLLPGEGAVEITIADAKGIKMFRQELDTNAFGVAPFNLPLATELNFGTWKLTARSGVAKTVVDVRVEKYVLPKFDLQINTGQDYFLVNDPVEGAVSAFYFFGKPIAGTAEIRASRYVGVWEEYANYTGALEDGLLAFEFPAVNYVSGTPGNGGAGNLLIEITVTDTSGHAEKYSEFFRIPQADLHLQVIPLAPRMTPSTAFDVAVAAQTPDGATAECSGTLSVAFATLTSSDDYGNYYEWLPAETQAFSTTGGLARITLTAPDKVVKALITAAASSGGQQVSAQATLFGMYSPTSNFIRLTRSSSEPVTAGDMISFEVLASQAVTVYYDVFAAGRTVFSGYTPGTTISFRTTPAMAPSAKVVAYVINPDNEVSADAAPFDVQLSGTGLDAWFGAEQVLPGDPVQVGVQAGTEAMVGVSIVDESVYALNQGRLNLREVFAELEAAYMEPQQETHPSGAYDILTGAGLCVMSSADIAVPQSPERWWDMYSWEGAIDWEAGEGEAPAGGGEGENGGLAEVTRVRQFFPETWVWMPELLTDGGGNAVLDLTAPDSITTWKLHAVSTSQQGVGIAESELVVFQEFFGEPDLPYAVTRGETFPVRVQIYNYLDTPQNVQVELAAAEWFELLEASSKTVSVEANSVALASFLIQPKELGSQIVEVTLRSPQRADAVRKPLLVEAEGTRREWVQNGTIEAGQTAVVSRDLPAEMVADSGKILLNLTPSIAAQCINGLDNLLGMPYGCGEQNMIFTAPDIEVLKYLDATEQAAPEVRAKAESYITTGYQRELTYQRSDGSFSAFGDQDDSGSLWLTAFVLKVFSGARELIAIDEGVLAQAAGWVQARQNVDGSWEPFGFLYHEDLVGGNSGVFPLTAYVALAMHAYNPASPGLTQAANYLGGHLAEAEGNPYALAIGALALKRLNHSAAPTALSQLLELAQSDENGIHWTPFDIETTSYAVLALIEAGNFGPVNDAVAWLAAQRNSLGGYTSTQDTVMAIEALLAAAVGQNRDMDLTVTVREAASVPYEGEKEGAVLAQFDVNADNFDVLQQVELAAGGPLEISAEGQGRVNFQVVRKFNVLLPEQPPSDEVGLEITYSADHVAVDDLVDVNVSITYHGFPLAEGEPDAEVTAPPQTSGMMLLDVGVPTGFAPVTESLDALKEARLISRFEVAGRKVILYILDMTAGQTVDLVYQIKARFPVRALTPDSYAYRYYEPSARDEVKGHEITIELDGNPHGIQDIHSADEDGDNAISLSELLRLIQFFNSGEYHCQAGTEDGFNPGAGSKACVPHAADYRPQDWSLSLSELLRLIQFFNMGGYRACPEDGTEDGYCPVWTR